MLDLILELVRTLLGLDLISDFGATQSQRMEG